MLDFVGGVAGSSRWSEVVSFFSLGRGVGLWGFPLVSLPFLRLVFLFASLVPALRLSLIPQRYSSARASAGTPSVCPGRRRSRAGRREGGGMLARREGLLYAEGVRKLSGWLGLRWGSLGGINWVSDGCMRKTWDAPHLPLGAHVAVFQRDTIRHQSATIAHVAGSPHRRAASRRHTSPPFGEFTGHEVTVVFSP